MASNFTIRDTFATDPKTLWESVISHEIENELARMGNAQREVLEEREEGGRIFRRVKYSSSDPRLAQLSTLLGGSSVSWEQHTWLDVDALKGTWKMLLPVGGDRIRIEGEYQITAHADGAERVVNGTVEVKVPLVGGRLESGIVDAVKKTYTQGTEWRRRRLAGG